MHFLVAALLLEVHLCVQRLPSAPLLELLWHGRPREDDHVPRESNSTKNDPT